MTFLLLYLANESFGTCQFYSEKIKLMYIRFTIIVKLTTKIFLG